MYLTTLRILNTMTVQGHHGTKCLLPNVLKLDTKCIDLTKRQLFLYFSKIQLVKAGDSILTLHLCLPCFECCTSFQMSLKSTIFFTLESNLFPNTVSVWYKNKYVSILHVLAFIKI